MGENDIKTQPDTNFEEAFEEISEQYENKSCTMDDLETMAQEMLATLPKLDRTTIRQEMEQMVVPMFQNPTTFDINTGLAKAQGYKDRLSEIYNLANSEYRLRKRILEMLFDAASVVSKQSSADKRKGEATMKYPVYLISLEAAETFVEEVQQVLANIKSASDSISRQGSIIQSQIQLGEYRKRVPDMQSNGSSAEEIDYKSGAPKIGMEWGEL
jgi:septation ring formation regulator EzrA